jgi:subtilase family serine protease
MTKRAIYTQAFSPSAANDSMKPHRSSANAFAVIFLPGVGPALICASFIENYKPVFPMSTSKHHAAYMVAKEIPGSSRSKIEKARYIGPVDNTEVFEVTVRLRRKAELELHDDTSFMSDTNPAQRNYLSREQYEESYGADQGDIDKVVAFAKEHELNVVDISVARRSVLLSGNAKSFSKAFGTEIGKFELDGATYRLRSGSITVPESLGDAVEGVFGIDNRPAGRHHDGY